MTPRATAAPRTRRPRIVAGYLRLTVDRHGNKIGYEGQRRSIQKWADAEDYEVAWFKDENLTAAKRKVTRPAYEDMLKRLAAGEFAGIVVWRLDRLVRLTREFERCHEVVEDAGAFIIDREQGVDSRTNIGQMMMRLMVMLAEMEINAMRARAREHQLTKAMKGQLSAGGHRPFGFIGADTDPETKKITNPDAALREHDPFEAPLLREAARRIAYGGASYADIAKEWRECDPPVRGTLGRPMDPADLAKILTKARTAGFREYPVIDDEGTFIETARVKADWEGIIDEQTWLALRARVKKQGHRTTKREYLLTGGLAKCGICNKPMVAGSWAKPGQESQGMYRCNVSVKAREAGSCGGPQAQATSVESVVLARLIERLEQTPTLYDEVIADASGTDQVAIAQREVAIKEIKLCDDELETLGERTTLPEDDPDYLTEAQERGRAKGWRARRSKAEEILREVSVSSGRPVPSAEDQQDIKGWFDSLALGEKRAWLESYLTDVFVNKATRGGRGGFDASRVVTVFSDAKTGRKARK